MFIILILVLILINGCNQLDSEACVAEDGRIVNRISEESCKVNETNIGEVQGLRCPCICCVPSK